jgi:murein DD-endopeptidase
LNGEIFMRIPSHARRAFVASSWLLVGLIGLGGCATSPTPTAPGDPHHAARQQILGAAERLIGTPYVLGGESPSGMDCSGLVQYAYSQAGIQVPRTSAAQFRAGQPQRRVRPGDLLFFRTTSAGVVSHVGIYAGQGQMIHASSGSRRIRKVNLNTPYWQQRMVGGATFLDSIQRDPVVRRGTASARPPG